MRLHISKIQKFVFLSSKLLVMEQMFSNLLIEKEVLDIPIQLLVDKATA